MKYVAALLCAIVLPASAEVLVWCHANGGEVVDGKCVPHKKPVYLWLTTYPACGDAIREMVSGPFATVEVCESVKTWVLKTRGSPEPGTIYECAVKR